jgi:hypothetical protein
MPLRIVLATQGMRVHLEVRVLQLLDVLQGIHLQGPGVCLVITERTNPPVVLGRAQLVLLDKRRI